MSSLMLFSKLLNESFSSVQGNYGGRGGDVFVEEAADETHDGMSTSTVAEVLSGQSRSVEITLNNNDLEIMAHCALKSSSCRRIYGSLRPILKALGIFLRAGHLISVGRAFGGQMQVV